MTVYGGDLSREVKTQFHMIHVEVLMSIKQRGYLIIITELPNRQTISCQRSK